jgi:hypothetical protein
MICEGIKVFHLGDCMEDENKTYLIYVANRTTKGSNQIHVRGHLEAWKT